MTENRSSPIPRHRRYGIWLLTGPRAFKHPDIWREDRHSYDVQTPFQRSVGVRYVGKGSPRFPDASMGFGSFVAAARHRSIQSMLKGYFEAGPPRLQSLALLDGHRKILAHASGYAIISSRRLRRVSKYGTRFVGMWRVRMEEA